jgi:hypothetical protein
VSRRGTKTVRLALREPPGKQHFTLLGEDRSQANSEEAVPNQNPAVSASVDRRR